MHACSYGWHSRHVGRETERRSDIRTGRLLRLRMCETGIWRRAPSSGSNVYVQVYHHTGAGRMVL